MPVPTSLPVENPSIAETLAPLDGTGPEVFFDASALPFLAGSVTVFHRFLTLLTQDVQREQLSAAKIEVRGTVDPEEDTSQILVRWMTGLSDEQREFFAAKISFQVRRVVNA
jgi:hypothetical protein